VQYTPVIYGHEGSITEIPKEVIDQYKNQPEKNNTIEGDGEE
jgi:hypothetical protein